MIGSKDTAKERLMTDKKDIGFPEEQEKRIEVESVTPDNEPDLQLLDDMGLRFLVTNLRTQIDAQTESQKTALLELEKTQAARDVLMEENEKLKADLSVEQEHRERLSYMTAIGWQMNITSLSPSKEASKWMASLMIIFQFPESRHLIVVLCSIFSVTARGYHLRRAGHYVWDLASM